MTTRPELALGIVAGSVLPDLDALARVFGKKSFLQVHQTWSHAIPLHVGASVLAGWCGHLLGLNGVMLGAGLLAGLVCHTFLDFTNTLGVTLLEPFYRKRLCLEWVFFIDAFVASLTFLATGITMWLFYRDGDVPGHVPSIFFGVLGAYIVVKAMLRRRAGTFAREAVSLIPSALRPWRFFGVVNSNECVDLFLVNAITGRRKTLAAQPVLDAAYEESLKDIPEFALMRSLSPAYHIVSARQTEAGTLLLCRDLRIRNFKTTFGDLEVLLDSQNRVNHIEFHV